MDPAFRLKSWLLPTRRIQEAAIWWMCRELHLFPAAPLSVIACLASAEADGRIFQKQPGSSGAGVGGKMLLFGLAAMLACPALAQQRDAGADLVVIGTRLIAEYNRKDHRSDESSGEFIEDVVIPAVHSVVDRGAGRLSGAQLDALADFFWVADGLASEEVSEIAAEVYSVQKSGICMSLGKLAKAKRAIVIERIVSGVNASGAKATPGTVCR
ncbi:hypothetical protein [Stenotrophomonas forensis]|uniref:hypothetical protein n=1 Tax=Stenotrophomonas forensis TaxID=2871169 RepID=UPI0039C72DAA